MINLHTGQPGHGKTLYTLSTVEARRIKENRHVYYAGINDLKLDWTLIEKPELWYMLPPGCIIVIDECQKLFPPRGNGAPIPMAESELETHRHKGFDIYLITQDPTFIPSHARKLADIHRHMRRKFGSKWVTVHQFERCRENVAKSVKDSIESQWVDDSSMYDKYKSAEVITQKIRVPLKVWLALLLPVAIIAGAYWFYQRRIAEQTPVPAANRSSSLPGTVPDSKTQQPVAQPAKRTYDLAAFAPRVEGLPHTAPRYDELTAPVRVPVVSGCVWFPSRNKGQCYTQQGTLLEMPASFIKQYLEKGMFEDFERGPSLGVQVAGSDRRSNDASPITRPPQAPTLPQKQAAGGGAL